MRWEYKKEYCCDPGDHNYPNYLLDFLNREGDDGWEFVCFSSGGYTAYFKRQKAEVINVNTHATIDPDALAKHGEAIADALTEQLRRGHRVVHDIRDVVANP